MEDESLLEAVRCRSTLYDVGCLNYINNDKKERAWQEISAELNRESN